MRLANQAAAIAFRILDQCMAEVRPAGPWRWRCVLQNGATTPIAATFEEGFLQLAGPPKVIENRARALEVALLENDSQAGGTRFALDATGSSLLLRADIVLLDETQLLNRVNWALAGFHHAVCRHGVLSSQNDGVVTQTSLAETNLGELLREASWQYTERGPQEFSASLDADSAPPVRIKASEHGLLFSVELVRAGTAAEVSHQALAEFLLSASSLVRLVRAHTPDVDGQRSFGLQICLPPAPAAQEVDHALAALSIAYRMCAREANALLDETVARCYLAARDAPTTHNHE